MSQHLEMFVRTGVDNDLNLIYIRYDFKNSREIEMKIDVELTAD